MKQSLNKQSIQLLPMGLIYFGLFSIAIWIDMYRRVFRFPKLDHQFLSLVVVDLSIGFIGGLVIAGLTFLATKNLKPFQDLSKMFSDLLGPVHPLEIFFLSSFSALGEEFFFRGIIQGELGLVFASLFFGLIHIGPNRKAWPWTLFSILVGFILGALYEWRGNLLTPVVMHFTINYVNLWLLYKSITRAQGAGSS